VGQSLNSLPPLERARRYRQFAAEGIRRADESADPEARAANLSMASGWHTLAIEVESAATQVGQATLQGQQEQDGDGDRH
jgi:hypothetical protein